MLLSHRKSLEELTILHLQKGPVITTDLLRLLQKEIPKTTKQGMYVLLRKLIQAEVILKHKKQISLNIAWLTKLESFISLAEHFYSNAHKSGGFLGLADGEKIKYEFQNLKVTDAFWNHVLYLLIEAHPKTPWFTYNPHCWFFLARPDSERALRDFVGKNGSRYLLTVGSKTPLDQAIKKEFDGQRNRYFMRESPLFPKMTYYVSVIADYIVEGWIDLVQTAAIEKLYTSADAFNPEIEKQLQDIITRKGRTKLVISRNKKKAEKLRYKLAKPFIL